MSCSHDGYKRLKGSPVHKREWRVKQGKIVVTDVITGGFEKAIGRFYLHPEVKPVIDDSDHGSLTVGEMQYKWHLTGGYAELKESTWHPEFGVSIQNYCIECNFTGSKTVFELTWD